VNCTIPSRRIHQLKNPNNKTGAHTIVEDIATLPVSTTGAFEFPNFIANKTGGNCLGLPGSSVKRIQVNNNRCTDRQVFFDATLTGDVCDSIRWNFDDPGKPDNRTNDVQIKRYFDTERIYYVECYLYYCNQIDTVRFELDMKAPPVLDLGNDTIICAGDLFGIGIELSYDSMKWADGTTAGPLRLAKPGTYSLTVYNGQCKTTDEITIKSHPEIWTALKAEYSICDIENEAVKLDAGKGFDAYRWIPTGDTTQWIIVQQIGEYMVIVDAFTGCSGDGKTRVKRACDIQIRIPNAFSPNNDGLNDVFRVYGDFIEHQTMKIYTLWGEQIWEESGLTTEWNGKDAPVGAYLYQIEVDGFHNKLPITLRKNGTVTLIR